MKIISLQQENRREFSIGQCCLKAKCASPKIAIAKNSFIWDVTLTICDRLTTERGQSPPRYEPIFCFRYKSSRFSMPISIQPDLCHCWCFAVFDSGDSCKKETSELEAWVIFIIQTRGGDTLIPTVSQIALDKHSSSFLLQKKFHTKKHP